MSIADDEADVEEDEREDEETDGRLELSDTDEEAELSSLEDIRLCEDKEDEWLIGAFSPHAQQNESKSNRQQERAVNVFMKTSQ